MMKGRSYGVWWWKAAVSLVAVSSTLWALTGHGVDAQSAIGPEQLEYGILRTALIENLIRDQAGAYRISQGGCAASFVGASGLILTLSRCLRASRDLPDLGLHEGQPFNPEGRVIVSVVVPEQSRSIKEDQLSLYRWQAKGFRSQRHLMARLVADDPAAGLALLRAESILNQGSISPLTPDFRVPFFALGDTESLQKNAPVGITGHPNEQGNVTVGDGRFDAIHADQDGRPKAVMVICCPNITLGGGGPIFNVRGELVSVYRNKQYKAATYAIPVNRIPAQWAQQLRTAPSGAQAQQPLVPAPQQPAVPGPQPVPPPGQRPTEPVPPSASSRPGSEQDRIAQLKAAAERLSMRFVEAGLIPPPGNGPPTWYLDVAANYTQPTTGAVNSQAFAIWAAMHSVLSAEPPQTILSGGQIWHKYALISSAPLGTYADLITALRRAQSDAEKQQVVNIFLGQVRARIWDRERRQFVDVKDFVNKNFAPQ